MKQEHDFLYSFFRVIYKTILKILYRPKIIGIENLPEDRIGNFGRKS